MPTPGYSHEPGCSQAARLTDEQVAEALRTARTYADLIDCDGRTSVGRLALAAIQVSADLSAAKEEKVDSDRVVTENYDAIAAATGCPTWEYPGQVVRGVQELAKAALASESALSALQEAAREAVEAMETAHYALKHANSLRNGGFNEALAPKRNRPDSTGITAAQYSRANNKTEAANLRGKKALSAAISSLRAHLPEAGGSHE